LDDWNTETYPTIPSGQNTTAHNSRVVIKNCSAPANGSFGALLVLKTGVPAIVNFENNNMVNSPFIKTDAGFDLPAYLTTYNAQGSISIKIKGNNYFSNVELYPKELNNFIEIDYVTTDTLKNGYNKTQGVTNYLPKVLTDVLIGNQYINTDITVAGDTTKSVLTNITASKYKSGVFLVTVIANKNLSTAALFSRCSLWDYGHINRAKYKWY
jgi:hypothetical protein